MKMNIVENIVSRVLKSFFSKFSKARRDEC